MRIVIKEDDHILQVERRKRKKPYNLKLFLKILKLIFLKNRKSMLHSVNDVPNP